MLVFNYSSTFGNLYINAAGCVIVQTSQSLSSMMAICLLATLLCCLERSWAGKAGEEVSLQPIPWCVHRASKHAGVAELKRLLIAFADAVERKAGMSGGMNVQKAQVKHMLQEEVAKVRLGTILRPEGSTPLTAQVRHAL